MSSEDTLDAATASESKDTAPPPATATSEAQDAPPADSASKLVRVSLVAAAGAVQVQPRAYSSQGCRQESDEGDDPIGRRATEIRARWFKDMRGWIMVLAMQVASSTYQAGLNPPGGFSGDGTPMLKSTSQNRYYYYMFFYFNTTAFVTSLAIILLLMNPSFYHSEAKVLALETIVVLDVVGLMGAYWAGTASATRDQVTKYTLALTAVVLFVVYVVYMVQLLHKLWRLATAIALRHAPPMRARAANAAPPGT
ncbi:hypothetical protein HU200_015517 [Digitaria exilis]|uniref:PGG domain-containing protein n=1 Tax=Digitaria exilis TaxID=1010633 RepID=A0A835FBK2_9POAL|nr:hypothetical protein HU200_015517 [Digitaria exilis]